MAQAAKVFFLFRRVVKEKTHCVLVHFSISSEKIFVCRISVRRNSSKLDECFSHAVLCINVSFWKSEAAYQ